MLTFPTQRHSLKRNFCHKNFFLVNLLASSFNWAHQKAGIYGKKSLHSFIHVFLIFDFKHIVGEVGRKFVMGHVFCMNREFKAQLCLWAPPCPIDLMQSWYKNSGLAWTPESPHPLKYKHHLVLVYSNSYWYSWEYSEMLFFISNWIFSLGQVQKLQFFLKIRDTMGIYSIFSSEKYGVGSFFWLPHL